MGPLIALVPIQRDKGYLFKFVLNLVDVQFPDRLVQYSGMVWYWIIHWFHVIHVFVRLEFLWKYGPLIRVPCKLQTSVPWFGYLKWYLVFTWLELCTYALVAYTNTVWCDVTLKSTFQSRKQRVRVSVGYALIEDVTFSQCKFSHLIRFPLLLFCPFSPFYIVRLVTKRTRGVRLKIFKHEFSLVEIKIKKVVLEVLLN